MNLGQVFLNVVINHVWKLIWCDYNACFRLIYAYYNIVTLDMSLKTLHYFGLLILPSIILGQLNSTISNGMEKELMPNSILKECYSGPIVWSNCQFKGVFRGGPEYGGGMASLKFPMVRQL